MKDTLMCERSLIRFKNTEVKYTQLATGTNLSNEQQEERWLLGHTHPEEYLILMFLKKPFF